MKPFNLKAPETIRAASKDGEMRIFAREADAPELMVMDTIGDDGWGEGVKASDVVAFLGKHKGQAVTVRINSLGGSLYDGLVIHNALAGHDGEVTGIVEGIAFSAASILAMGCHTLKMQKASDFGIHRAWTIAAGNAKDMAGVIEWLNATDQHQVEIFKAKTGASEDQVNAWLDGTSDGTIFGSSEAMEAGFVDEVIELRQNAAQAAKRTNAAVVKTLASIRQQRLRAQARAAS